MAWDQECFALAEVTLPDSPEMLDIYARTIAANRVTMDPGYARPGAATDLVKKVFTMDIPWSQSGQYTLKRFADKSGSNAPEEPIVFDKNQQVDFAATYTSLKNFMQATLDAGESIAVEGNMDPWAAQYARVLQRMTRKRRFFATENGRIGLGPADTKGGDALCIIFYCPTPYLLRHRPKASRLVGEAFVDGLMYGEALQLFDAGECSETKWVID